jgi:hypothetical protein
MSEYRNLDTPRRTTRTSLLATSGLAVLMFAALPVRPAHAQMTVTAGGSVQVDADTATTATTNTDGAIASSFDQVQLWDNGTAITAGTDGVDSITGNGLVLEETGATAASITMTNAGNSSITSSSGIGLQMLGNGGGITYTDTSGNAVTGNTTGISASEIGNGAVTLTVNGTVTGNAGDGIDTSAVNGNTLVTIDGGYVQGSAAGINASATGSGNLAVVVTSTNGGGTVFSGTSAGVELNQTGTGSNTITNDGYIFAGTATAPAIAIATTNSGTSTITNNADGSIYSGAGTTGLAILSTVTTGKDIIVNAGSLWGEIYLSNQSNSLNNSGFWYVEDGVDDAATFGTSGLNILINSGTINAGTIPTSTSTFTGVETVNNSGTINVIGTATFATGAAQTVTNAGTIAVNGTASFVAGGASSNFYNAGGLIDMRNDETTDVTALNVAVTNNSYTPMGTAYNFVGGAGSTLGLDTLVGGVSSSGTNLPSDRLVINGTATGTTGILLNDTGTVGSYNPVGITLVAVNGASTDAFNLQGVTTSTPSDDIFEPSRGPMGAIKKGFWFYPLLQTTHATAVADGLTGANSSEYRLYGLPDVEAFQTPLAITGAENIWYDTVLGWSDRQDELRKHWTAVYGAANAEADGKFNFWMNATGSWDNRTNTNSLSLYTTAVDAPTSIDTSFSQNTYSMQVGVDVGISNILDKDDAIVLGVSGGYVDSNLRFKTSDNDFDYKGVTLAATADYLHGGWFWDTALKADLLQATLNYNSLVYFGYSQQAVEADTWGVLSSAGYHLDLGGAAFLEPLATIAHTSSTLGNFDSVGTTANFNASNTFRGALGARFGGELLRLGDTIVNASVTGDYWDEFTNDTSATLLSAGPALTLSDVREKGYGEVTGQVNIAHNGTGWSGFLDGGAKFNSQSTSIEFNAGIAYKW